MRALHILLAALLPAASAAAAGPARDAASYVNPIIGTNGMGHTFPGACAPFGLVQLSPETDTVPHNVGGKYQPRVYEYCAGYQHRDSTIVGFSHTHLSGTGHSDLGDILLMPVTGPLRLNPGTAADPDGGYRSRFSHRSERCAPGYYEVLLSDYGVLARLTATPRVGVHEYTFPSRRARVVVDLGSGIYNYEGKTLWTCLRVVNDTLLTGYRLTNGWARQNFTYFAIALSSPLASYGYADRQPVRYGGFWGKMDIHHSFPDMAAREMSAWLEADLPESRKLTVRVALSPVSMSGAVANLRAETGGRSFEEIRRETARRWGEELGCLEAEGTDDQKTLFYTSLYHTMINPSVYMDVDGRYRGNDMETRRAEGYTNYTIFSLWDTFRAEHPLLHLLKPRRGADMARSMVAAQGESALRLLPMWYLMGNEGFCMSGYHAVPVLADAAAKLGLADTAATLRAMRETATSPWIEGMGDYMRLGYVPCDRCATSASNTLEYAYDDWAVYRTALAAGDTALASVFRRRAMNYRNVFDPSLGLARPRRADGSWRAPFSPLQTYGEGFIEGNSANYSFHVPHDVKGMIACFGGERRFVERLDSLFTQPLDKRYYQDNEDIEEECLMGGYVHGNEPSHHVAYLYAWTSQPWKSQYWLREIMNRMYVNDMDGLHGNDDCGQMSAWYVFTAMGFYPVCPGTDQYVLGAPYLPSCRVRLPNGRSLLITAPGVSDSRRYVSRVLRDGRPYDKLYITHQDLMRGGTLQFVMSSRPDKRRGARSGKPYSLSD